MDFKVYGQPSNRIYFDHNATAPVAMAVADGILSSLKEWGNPSSIHTTSRGPKQIIRETRQKIAQAIGCHALEIVFNSGGSESNTSIIKSCYEHFKNSERNEYITTQVEHPSVLKTFKLLEQKGVTVHYIPVSIDGHLDIEFYKKCLSKKTALVSVMFANNEIGSVFPIAELSEAAHKEGALFHSDCVQALGKYEFNIQNLGIDYASFSGHKFYALKGSGFMFIKKNCPFDALIIGGGQERHRRGGTENVLGIASLGQVFDMYSYLKNKTSYVLELKKYLEDQILKNISNVEITAVKSIRLANTSHMTIWGCDGETLLMSLDLKGYSVSTGAACSSGSPEPSPVLLAIGFSRERAQNSLRISLGWENTKQEVDQFVADLSQVVEHLRKIQNDLNQEQNDSTQKYKQ